MTPTDQTFASLHFSTRALAASKRLSAVRDLFDRAVQLEFDAEPEQAIEMRMHLAPGLRRAQMLSPMTARMNRSAAMLSDGEDTVCLMVKTGGKLAVSQRGRQGIPNDGDGVLLVYRETARLEFVDATYLSIRVPYTALAGMTNPGAVAAGIIPSGTEALSLLVSYVSNLPERFEDPSLARLGAAHVYDLVALALGATPEAREVASGRGVRAARLKALQADLISDPSLSLAGLALKHRVTPRYIQMLFEEAGTTLTMFVQELRLAQARQMLVSPRCAGMSITEVAFEAGFGDLSHFNRLFKRRYQMTPGDMRGRREDMFAGLVRPQDPSSF